MNQEKALKVIEEYLYTRDDLIDLNDVSEIAENLVNKLYGAINETE
jgi:hypothetical protein